MPLFNGTVRRSQDVSVPFKYILLSSLELFCQTTLVLAAT